MAPIVLTDAQLHQVMTQAHQVPRALQDMYLRAVAERLRGGGYARNPIKARAAHQGSVGSQ